MAAQASGRAKKPKKAASNGALNGSLNGHVNGHANGHVDKLQSLTTTRPKGQRKPRRTMAGAATSIVARYVICHPQHMQCGAAAVVGAC
jgi:hypothetical protein